MFACAVNTGFFMRVSDWTCAIFFYASITISRLVSRKLRLSPYLVLSRRDRTNKSTKNKQFVVNATLQ
jgi:hypothetical protein